MPTLIEIKDRIYNDFIASFDNAITPLKKSFFEMLANAISGSLKLLYIFLDNVQNDSFLNSCTQSRVLNYFAPLNKLSKKEATKATGTVTFTGVDTTIIPIGTKVIYNSNLEYETTVEGTIAGGMVDIICKSVETGSLINTISPITLSLVIPVVGVDNGATSSLGFTGAIDEETVENLRTRTIIKQGSGPQIDNANYYKSLGNEVPNVKATFIADIKNGVGTFGVTILTKSNNGVPVLADILSVEAHFNDNKAVPIYVTAEYFLPNTSYQNFSILLAVNDVSNQERVEQVLRDYLYIFQKAGTTFSFLGLSKTLQSSGARLVSPFPTDTLPINIDTVVDVGTITWT